MGRVWACIKTLFRKDPVISIATVVIAVSTAVSTYVASLQWSELAQSSAQTQRSIEAANRLANAAVRANRLAERNAKIQLRAHVYVRAQGVWNVDESNPMEVYLSVTNFGATQARNIQARIGVRVLPHPLPKGTTLLKLATAEPGPTILPSKDRYLVHRTVAKTLAKGQRKALSRKTLAIYIFGEINYTDAFGGNHRDPFCHFFFGNRANSKDTIYIANQARPCEAK